ncbi:PKD domain-containing protein, partial [Coraliomargarita sp. SDUM461004]
NGEVAVYRSSDGANWEDLSNGTGLDSWQDFREIEYLEGAFYASGHYSRARRSTDAGQTWSSAQTGDYHQLTGYATINGIYYGVGYNLNNSYADIDLISTDGIDWIPINPGAVEDRQAIIAFNNTFISVGLNGSIRQSLPINPDNAPPTGVIIGHNQTEARQLNLFTVEASDPDGDDLIYIWDMGDGSEPKNSPSITHSWSSGGNYEITLILSDTQGGYTTLSHNMSVDDPLNTWLDRSSGTALNLLGIAANETHVVAVGANGTILRSVDGATWTKQPLSGVAA